MNPFVEAVKKLPEPYIKEGFDIFKTSFSVSGVAKLKMLKEICKDTFFCLFPKRHADLYQKLRSQLTGGLSLIFTRLAIVGETYIKPNRYENPCKVAKIVGYDANSLYLHAIKAPNPTGYFCRYKEGDYYRPDPCCRYGLSCFQWLSWVSHSQNKIIQHKFNSGEVRFTEYSLPVDGYCEEEKLVFQFDGCLFHSCSVCTINRNPDGSLQETNPFNNLKHEDIRKKTEENTKILQDAGYQVIRMRECTWKKMKTNPHIVSFLKNLKTVTPKRQLSF